MNDNKKKQIVYNLKFIKFNLLNGQRLVERLYILHLEVPIAVE